MAMDPEVAFDRWKDTHELAEERAAHWGICAFGAEVRSVWSVITSMQWHNGRRVAGWERSERVLSGTLVGGGDTQHVAQFSVWSPSDGREFGSWADAILAFTEVLDGGKFVWEDDDKNVCLAPDGDGPLNDDRVYWIAEDRFDTPEKVLDWLTHLSEKLWFTTAHAEAMLNIANRRGLFERGCA